MIEYNKVLKGENITMAETKETKDEEIVEVKVENTTDATPMEEIPGKKAGTTSMILGIISVVCWFFGWSALVSIILGIIGLVQAKKSKEAGYEGGDRTAGFVLSIIGLIGGAIVFIACVACAGLIGAGASAGLFDSIVKGL